MRRLSPLPILALAWMLLALLTLLVSAVWGEVTVETVAQVCAFGFAGVTLAVLSLRE